MAHFPPMRPDGSPKSDVLGALLKAQPEGKVMWVAVRGSSMRPVLTGGESLKVVRCSEAALKPGDIAVMLRSDGALIGHLVVSTAPLRTESFSGTPDAPGLEVLARAVAVRRGSLVVPLPFVARSVLLGLQRAWNWAVHSAATRAAHTLAVAVVSSEHTGPVRAMLGPVELQLLGPAELKDVAVGLSRWVTLSGDALEALLRDGVALGVRRRGRLVGFAFVTPDQILRYAFLQRRAQGLGLEHSLVERAIREAEARGLKVLSAQIDRSQPGFLAAARAFGLHLGPPGSSRG